MSLYPEDIDPNDKRCKDCDQILVQSGEDPTLLICKTPYPLCTIMYFDSKTNDWVTIKGKKD